MSTQSFYAWLQLQTNRDDPVGDLARDTAKDPDCPRRAATYGRWLKHLYEREPAQGQYLPLSEPGVSGQVCPEQNKENPTWKK